MKKIVATIKPFKFDEVKEALARLGITGLRVVESKGFGRQKGHPEIYHGAEYAVQFLPKLDVITVVPDYKVGPVVHAIQTAAKTGRLGDGRIEVVHVEQFVNIRTGETGDDATCVRMVEQSG